MVLTAIAFVVIFGALVCFLMSCRMNSNKVEKKVTQIETTEDTAEATSVQIDEF